MSIAFNRLYHVCNSSYLQLIYCYIHFVRNSIWRFQSLLHEGHPSLLYYNSTFASLLKVVQYFNDDSIMITKAKTIIDSRSCNHEKK